MNYFLTESSIYIFGKAKSMSCASNNNLISRLKSRSDWKRSSSLTLPTNLS